MTKIILLMWLSDVVGSFGFVAGICWIAMTITLIVVGTKAGVDKLEEEYTPGFFKSIFWRAAFVPIYCLMFIGLILPNKQTIQAAIAVQAGEQLAKTAIGEKAYKALDLTLDKIITDNKGSK